MNYLTANQNFDVILPLILMRKVRINPNLSDGSKIKLRRDQS